MTTEITINKETRNAYNKYCSQMKELLAWRHTQEEANGTEVNQVHLRFEKLAKEYSREFLESSYGLKFGVDYGVLDDFTIDKGFEELK